MKTKHPITPPPELVDQWRAIPEYADISEKLFSISITTNKLRDIATQAARWGADQQLEMDATWVALQTSNQMSSKRLMAEMRPKPPSLKEQALAELELLRGDANAHGLGFDAPAIRRALEALPDV
jgi:hypothetical protein